MQKYLMKKIILLFWYTHDAEASLVIVTGLPVELLDMDVDSD
jgi:hypothetical protein